MSTTDDMLQNPSNWVLGKGPRARELARVILAVAQKSCAALILGETGAGKDIVARLIHSSGPRSTKAFVAVNCPATPASLMESLLFGKLKGSYTGADRTTVGHFGEADGGILFLDEVGELDPAVQPKLLRATESLKVTKVGESTEHEVDVQIICATNRDLLAEIDAGRFKRDLYYRLAVVQIEVPPLRDRPEDLPTFVRYFSERFAQKYGMEIKSVDHHTMEQFLGYTWPGNIRELSHLIQQAYVLNHPIRLPEQRPMEKEVLPTLNFRELRDIAIRIALRKSSGVASQAARMVGIGQATLERHAPPGTILRRRVRAVPAPSDNGASASQHVS